MCVCHFCVTAENSLLRFSSEDKTPGENFLLGRSLSQNRRKPERGGSPTHYTLVPALQMDVSLSTSTSDSASLYHVSVLWKVFFPSLEKQEQHCTSLHVVTLLCFTLQVFERSSLLSRSKKKSKGRRVGLRSDVLTPTREQAFHKKCFLTPSSVLIPCWYLQLQVPCLQSASDGFPAGT